MKKDIDYFTKLPPASEEKYKVYEDITKKLNNLEAKNKWVMDVKELKKRLDLEYYR
jgi:hypothetical protein